MNNHVQRNWFFFSLLLNLKSFQACPRKLDFNQNCWQQEERKFMDIETIRNHIGNNIPYVRNRKVCLVSKGEFQRLASDVSYTGYQGQASIWCKRNPKAKLKAETLEERYLLETSKVTTVSKNNHELKGSELKCTTRNKISNMKTSENSTFLLAIDFHSHNFLWKHFQYS